MYMIRAWDYDYIFGYVSKITKKGFEIGDSCYALKFKTRADTEKVIKVLQDNTSTELKFVVVKID